MFMLRVLFSLLISSFCFLFILTPCAYAYIDPGTGSLIWQLILSSFLGALFVFRKTVSKVAAKFKKGN